MDFNISEYKEFIETLPLDDYDSLRKKYQKLEDENKQLISLIKLYQEKLNKVFRHTSNQEVHHTSNQQVPETLTNNFNNNNTSNESNDGKTQALNSGFAFIQSKKRKRQTQKHSIEKKRHVQNLHENAYVKYPTDSDMPSTNLYKYQHIYNTMVKLFKSIPGDILTSQDIVKYAGTNVLNPHAPCITEKDISTYFCHKFNIQKTDKTFEVRPAGCSSESTRWIVHTPEWLAEEMMENCKYIQH